MNYCDLNIHLPAYTKSSSMLTEELNLRGEKLIDRLDTAIKEAGKNLKQANIMLFNEDLDISDFDLLTKYCVDQTTKLYFTLLCSPEKFKDIESLRNYKKAGLSAIKFHSYQQRISIDQFDSFVLLAKYAEELNMPILVDASYGSLYMYDFDNLLLISTLAKSIKSVPIVILHSGGSRVLEAMLLAESCPNIYLETSFTLPYYLNSTIELDLAFAYKTINSDKIIYASDHPYIKHSDSLHSAHLFFNKHNFSSADKENIFYKSFSKIFS